MSTIRTRLAALGFLRLSLLGLALIDVLWSAGYRMSDLPAEAVTGHSVWVAMPTLVAPVMAPILIVVILFDYIMARVQTGEAQGERRAHHVFICRLDLFFIGILLAYWIPFFVNL